MIERLHQETSSFHAEATDLLETLFRPHILVEDYRDYLIRNYAFEAPLEYALALSSELEMLLDLRARARASLIAQDLVRLGMRPTSVADLPICLTVPQFRGTAEALGWMFVVERAALSHAMIHRHLVTCLPEVMRTASAYLQSDGDLLGTRWRKFGEVLDDVGQHPAVADRIVGSAMEAFRCQRRWMSQESRGRPQRALL
jgi:heme oxygenase (biliverdin-IX-beta and delta-forming)